MSSVREYEGGELDLFLAARNWKHYWSRKVSAHLGKTVLEVGAGFGANTPFLYHPSVQRWVCVEPDAALAARIPEHIGNYPWAQRVEVLVGTLLDIPAEPAFDTLLYIDVLEHIEDDRAELEQAVLRLNARGKVIVLSPAHPSLFSEFDREIGHFRRYTKESLTACGPQSAKLADLYYLDSVGLLASVANRVMLRQTLPTAEQIALWDRWLVRSSCFVDPLVGFRIGKTVVAIWEKT